MARHVLRSGDRIRVNAPAELPQKLRVLWREDPFLVLDKPPGIVSNGPGSLETQLQSSHEFMDWRAVHRLDRDTSGCILFAASLRDKEAIVKQFRSNSIRKIYHAIVTGRTSSSRTSLKAPLEEKKAVTRFEVLDSNRLATHIRVELRTGRTHQIRKHMASMGHQVVGDKTYRAGSPIDAEFQSVPRQMLHAQKFGFIHPETGKEIRVAAPLPPDFRRTLKSLRLR
jgi:23S rRNA pseudouridine1911/1915/1917 synthase